VAIAHTIVEDSNIIYGISRGNADVTPPCSHVSLSSCARGKRTVSHIKSIDSFIVTDGDGIRDYIIVTASCFFLSTVP
jgi:hypothetical protein